MRDKIYRDDALNFNFSISPQATRMTSLLIEECFKLYQEHIRRLPVASDWVPVEKSLPETDESVLVTAKTAKGLSVLRASYSEGKWKGAGGNLTVTAWQPLPDPYK